MSGQCRISRSRPAKELSRRGFLAAIEGVSILAGCVDFEPRPEPQSFRSGSQWPVSVKKAKSTPRLHRREARRRKKAGRMAVCVDIRGRYHSTSRPRESHFR